MELVEYTPDGEEQPRIAIVHTFTSLMFFSDNGIQTQVVAIISDMETGKFYQRVLSHIKRLNKDDYKDFIRS